MSATLYRDIPRSGYTAEMYFLRALWRIGDGLFSISRAIASKPVGSDSD